MSDMVISLRFNADGTAIVDSQVKGLGKSLERTGDKATGASRSLDQTKTSVKQLQQGALSLRGTLASLGLALTLREVGNLADGYANTNSRLKLVTDSSAELVGLQRELQSTARGTFTAYADIAELYTRVAQNTDELVLSQSQMVELTETISQAFAVSGASTQEQAGATRQLTQSLASGVLRGEEFNSVAEQGTRILAALKDSLGKTRGELKAMADDGQLTADLVIGALLDQSNAIEQEFSNVPLTIGRASTIAANALSQYIGKADQANGASAAVAQGIVGVADNLDDLVDATIIAGTTLGSAYATQIAVSTSATLAQSLATAKLTASNLAAAESEVAIAAAEVARLKTLQQKSGMLALATGNTNAMTAATERLAAAETKLTAARSAQTTAIIGPGALLASVVGLTAGLIALGRAHNAEREAARLSQAEIYKTSAAYETLKATLDSFGDSPDGDQARAAGLARDLKQQIEGTAEQIRNLQDQGDSLSRQERQVLENARKSLSNFKAQANELIGLHPQLKAFFETLNQDTGPATPQRSAFDEISASLNEQIAAYQGGAATLAAYTREQEISKQVTDLVKKAGKENEAQLRSLVTTLVDAKAEHKQWLEQQREEQALAQSRESIDQQIQAMREQILLIEAGIDAEDAALDVRLAAAGATDAQREVYSELSAQLREYQREQEGANELTDEAARIAERLKAELEQRVKDVALKLDVELNLKDSQLQSLTGQFKELDGIRAVFNGIGGAGEEAIGRIVDAAEQFAVIGAEGADATFGAYAQGSATALKGIQAFVDKGSKEYERLGVVIQALQTAAAVQAVATASTLPPPAGFAAGAAMLASMLSLGIAIKGAVASNGSARAPQANAFGQNGLSTAGTVLGDSSAASESIANSLDLLVDIAKPELELTSQMARSLKNIEASSAGLSSLAQQALAIRGSLDGLVLDRSSVGGLSSLQSSDYEPGEYFDSALGTVTRRFGLQFSSALADMVDIVVAASAQLGESPRLIREQLESLTTPEIFIDLDDPDNSIHATLSGLADSLVGQLDLVVEDFILSGEGLLETLARVAGGYGAAELAAEQLGIALLGLDSVSNGTDDIGAELLRLSAVAAETKDELVKTQGPGKSLILTLQQTRSGIGDLIENFVGSFDETQEFIASLFDLRENFQLLGFQVSDVSAESLRAAGGLDALVDGLQSFRTQFFSEAEQIDFLTQEVSGSFAALGLDLHEQILGADSPREAFQELVTGSVGPMRDALLALAPELDELLDRMGISFPASISEAVESLDGFNDQVARFRTDLQRQITDLRGGSVGLFDVATVLDAIGDATDPRTLLDLLGQLQAAVTTVYQEQVDATETARQAQLDALNETHRLQMDALQDQRRALVDQIRLVERLHGTAEGLRDYLTELDFNSFSNLIPQDQLTAAQQELFALATAAQNATLSHEERNEAASAMQGVANTVLRLNEEINASGAAGQAIIDTVKATLGAVATNLEAIDPQLQALSDIDTSIADLETALGTQTDAINATFDQALSDLKDDLVTQLSGISGLLDQIVALANADPGEQQGIIDAIHQSAQDITGNYSASLADVNTAVGTSNTSLAAIDGATDGLEARTAGTANNFVDLEEDIRESLFGLYRGIWSIVATLDTHPDMASTTANVSKAGSIGQYETFATGGAFTNGLVTRPTFFDMGQMGEAGPEAIMPLSTMPDGSLGIRSIGPNMDDRAIVQAIEKLSKKLGNQAGQNLHITVVTEDGEVLEKRVIKNIKRRSRDGEVVIHARGVAA